MWTKQSEKVRRLKEEEEAMGIRSNYQQYECASGVFAMIGLGVIIGIVIVIAVCL